MKCVIYYSWEYLSSLKMLHSMNLGIRRIFKSQFKLTYWNNYIETVYVSLVIIYNIFNLVLLAIPFHFYEFFKQLVVEDIYLS
jgi:hypothetical protein